MDNSIISGKVSGSNRNVEINLNADQPLTLAGVCIFVTGNQNKVIIRVGSASIAKLVVIARGNQAAVSVEYEDLSEFGQVIASLKGNQTQLQFTGPLAPACPINQTVISGNSSGLICSAS